MSDAQLLARFTSYQGDQHWMTLEAMHCGARYGNYLALCGQSVLPASLTAPALRWCAACRSYTRQAATPSTSARGRPAAWLNRLRTWWSISTVT